MQAGIFWRNPVQSAGERLRTRDKIHRLIEGNAPMTRTPNVKDNVTLVIQLLYDLDDAENNDRRLERPFSKAVRTDKLSDKM